MHHCSSGADQLGKEAEGLWLAGSSEPMCSCVLTLFCSFAIVCSDFWLCVQAFPSVLKLPKRLPMCAKSNSQHKDSHLWSSANSQTLFGRRAALRCFAARCFLGILWVFCGYFAGMQMQCRPAVSRVTELGPRPCWDPRGSELLPCAGLFSPEATVSPSQQSTPHRDLHHESMSQKFENTFPIPTNPEYNWFEELLKMLSDRAGQGLKTP